MPLFLDEEAIIPFGSENEPENRMADEDLQETAGGSTLNGSDPDSSSSSLFDPMPNPMGDLYQPTYYFKLYVLNDLNPQEGVNEVIIAETGNTALNINDVRIEGIVGPNMRTRNSMATNITIKMTEPFGMNLPDRMVAAARKLKIKNYLKAAFMLKLELKGYDSTGRYVSIGEGWRWRIMIIDIKSNISETGAEHTLSAIPFPEIALQDQNGILPINVAVEGSTVGEILNGVVDRLNAHMEEIHGFDFVTYKIIDVPYPDSSGVPSSIARPFDHKVDSDQPEQENERGLSNNGLTKAQFSQGSDIPSVIDNVFSASKTAVELATLERSITPNYANDQITRQPSSILHRVDTYVNLKKFDPIYGDYQKDIIFVVRPYESMRIQSALTSAKSMENENDADAKIQHAIKRLFLCKQYDYIFTGKNTEIERFDIEVNFRWAVSAPLVYQDGIGANYDSTTSPRYISSEADDQELTVQSVNRDLQNNNEAQQTQTAFLESGTGTEEENANAQATLAALRNQQRRLEETRSILGEIRRKNLEEFEEGDEEVILAEELDTELSVAHPVTIIRSAENPTIQSGVGMPNRRDGTKSVYGTLLNQLYGTFDGNLQTITLEVRGDPYWLGPDPTPAGNFNILEPEAVASRYGASTQEKPNLMNGEHMFAFNFGLPQGYDEGTGPVALSNDETYSGLYAVSKIEHVFTGGKFTQKLDAYRIPGLALRDLNQTSNEDTVDDTSDLQANSQDPINSLQDADNPLLSTRFNPPPIDASLDGLEEEEL